MENTYIVFKTIVIVAMIAFLGIAIYPVLKHFPTAIFIVLFMGAIICLNILKAILEEDKRNQQYAKIKKEKARLKAEAEAERQAAYEKRTAERKLEHLQQKEELLRIKKQLRLEREKLNQERNAFRHFPNSDYYDNQYW